eukprot:c3234_g1_i1.p1 GENE.c3234_g1_i1~~c3234_g1_i1.p1  ORF type:complete len:307 (+),score=70.69 c3234_g1_i1:23-922(+)
MAAKFTYVFIPCEDDKPIVEHTATTEGGLENDALMAHAKQHFGHVTEGLLRQSAKDQLGQTNVSDSILRAAEKLSSVEIFAITVPTPKANHVAVSMYCDDHGIVKQLPVNARVTKIVQECGHSNHITRGDCFIGRYFDDDEEWRRIDFTIADCSTSSSFWIKQAKEDNSSDKSAASRSLSGLLQNMSPPSASSNTPAAAKGPAKEPWGEWDQNDEELTLKVSIPSTTQSRDVKVDLKPSTVKLTVGGKVLLSATLPQQQQRIRVDESLWTIDVDQGNKSVCITAAKAQGGVWLPQFDAV